MPRNVTFIKRDHSLAPGEKYNFIAAKLHIGLRNRETPYIRGAIDCRPYGIRNTFLSGRDRGVQSTRRPLTRDASGPGFRSAEPHRFRSTAQPTDPDRRPSWCIEASVFRGGSIEISASASSRECKDGIFALVRIISSKWYSPWLRRIELPCMWFASNVGYLIYHPTCGINDWLIVLKDNQCFDTVIRHAEREVADFHECFCCERNFGDKERFFFL